MITNYENVLIIDLVIDHYFIILLSQVAHTCFILNDTTQQQSETSRQENTTGRHVGHAQYYCKIM